MRVASRGKAGVAAPVGSLLRDRLLADTGASERRLDIAGTDTAVLEAGDGPPLILMHGGVESGGAYWAPVIQHLAHEHRVIIPDVPGLGASQPAATLDDEFFSSWFTDFIAATCESKPALVVHSLHGTLAARFAAHSGELLSRLVLYGVPGVGKYRMPLGLMITAMLFDLSPTQRNQERFLRWALLDPDRARRQDPEWFDAFDHYCLEQAQRPHVRKTMRELVTICAKQIGDSELSRIRTPTALLWGREDRMTPIALAAQAHAHFGWSLHCVEDAGHACHMEKPLDFVHQLRRAMAAELNSTVEIGGAA